jgi:hypothetical protein
VTSLVGDGLQVLWENLIRKGWNPVSDMSAPRPTPIAYRGVYCIANGGLIIIIDGESNDSSKWRVFAATDVLSYNQIPFLIQNK